MGSFFVFDKGVLIMNEKYKIILENVNEYLANVDSNEFLDTFLKLQEQHEGSMTVDEFLKRNFGTSVDNSFYVLTIFDAIYDFDTHHYIKDDEDTIDVIRKLMIRELSDLKDEMKYDDVDGEHYSDEDYENVDDDIRSVKECKTIDDYNNIRGLCISIRKQSFETLTPLDKKVDNE